MKAKIYTLILVVILLISTLPLMNLSRYTHPSADDFAFSVDTRAEWQENHSVIGLAKAVHETAIKFYSTWEGKYSSYYLWALQPGIFGERYYKLTGFINIAVLGFSTLFFFITLVKRLLKGSLYQGIALGVLSTNMMLQWMPSVVEGLYWYNGSVGYNFHWAILLLLLSGMMLYGKEREIYNVADGICMMIGAFVLAGGNHVTAFLGILIFGAISASSIIFKPFNKYRISIPVLIVMLIGFIINVASSGTVIRASYFPERTGFFETIWLAVQNGIAAIEEWIGLPLILCIILAMPIIIDLINKFTSESEFKFGYPLLVFIFSVGIICAMFCPTIFVMQNIGGGRVRNVEYFTFVVLVFLNCIYFTGYALCRLREENVNVSWNEKIPIKYLMLSGVFIAGMLVYPIQASSGYKAVQTIASGEASQYSDEAKRRYEMSVEAEGEDLELMDFTVKPELLFFDDIRADKEHGNNIMYANYYRLNSVVLKYWE